MSKWGWNLGTSRIVYLAAISVSVNSMCGEWDFCIGLNRPSSWARGTSLRLRSSGSKTGTRLSNRNCAGRRLMSFHLDDLACWICNKCAVMTAE